SKHIDPCPNGFLCQVCESRVRIIRSLLIKTTDETDTRRATIWKTCLCSLRKKAGQSRRHLVDHVSREQKPKVFHNLGLSSVARPMNKSRMRENARQGFKRTRPGRAWIWGMRHQ